MADEQGTDQQGHRWVTMSGQTDGDYDTGGTRVASFWCSLCGTTWVRMQWLGTDGLPTGRERNDYYRVGEPIPSGMPALCEPPPDPKFKSVVGRHWRGIAPGHLAAVFATHGGCALGRVVAVDDLGVRVALVNHATKQFTGLDCFYPWGQIKSALVGNTGATRDVSEGIALDAFLAAVEETANIKPRV